MMNDLWSCYYRKKTTTWFSTVAGILSSGCPQYFKSGQKEFNKETGWWALQENVAPVIKFSEAGVEGVSSLLFMQSNTMLYNKSFRL